MSVSRYEFRYFFDEQQFALQRIRYVKQFISSIKKLATLLSMTSIIINHSCDSTYERIDLQGNDLFELHYINEVMLREIIGK
tara:strand:- start:8192 stop:8437 length:246 start_codon:yes stop_codon:yes gene_type:complete